MGFMDKAKQMADQAQRKIEETQKQFNESQAQKAGGQTAPAEAGVRYDEHGRPMPAGADQPSGADTPPASDPATAEGVSVPQPPEGLDNPDSGGDEATERPVPPPAPPKEGMNATPDPFKPIG